VQIAGLMFRMQDTVDGELWNPFFWSRNHPPAAPPQLTARS
jgi:hypothetical protein